MPPLEDHDVIQAMFSRDTRGRGARLRRHLHNGAPILAREIRLLRCGHHYVVRFVHYRVRQLFRGRYPRLLTSYPQDGLVRMLTQLTLSAKSDTTQAIQYALDRWLALVYYCSDGQAEIDNLQAEQALRGVAIGRPNFLFAGADSGRERAAVMYSLIGSVRLNGIDPEAYLHYVIERIADHPTNRIDELLPWNVAPLLPASARVNPIR